MFGGGETVTDAIAAVMRKSPIGRAARGDAAARPPPAGALPAQGPKTRLRDIGEARIVLDEAEPAAAAAPPVEGPVGKSGEFYSMRLSPDEKSVALTVGILPHSQLWMMDLATGVLARATGEPDAVSDLGTVGRVPTCRASLSIVPKAIGTLELTVATGKTRDLLPAGS